VLVLSRDFISPFLGTVLILFSLYLFIRALDLMVNRDAASSLLATILGLISLSSGVSIIRTWSLSRVVKEKSGETSKSS